MTNDGNNLLNEDCFHYKRKVPEKKYIYLGTTMFPLTFKESRKTNSDYDDVPDSPPEISSSKIDDLLEIEKMISGSNRKEVFPPPSSSSQSSSVPPVKRQAKISFLDGLPLRKRGKNQPRFKN
ncbi:hypothetical protein Phum_PHUM474400 [Pediculus humanus corporis]|uniref:Uncharacterized protein n=1 Tax=Pediculus humanus subsp. corporis TaxID=121224 RepID=E0VW51_PEDHC|nr:uncharacterized protein Phum_PHUM474400 [Pediculus humanus corporis]EEB17607.1 hypothetical protein Phum_PHUM474400 [Pediculus humanus corporis]